MKLTQIFRLWIYKSPLIVILSLLQFYLFFFQGNNWRQAGYRQRPDRTPGQARRRQEHHGPVTLSQAKSKTIFSKGIESEKWREGSGKPIHSWSTPSDSNKGSVIGLNALRWSDQSLILCSKLSLKFWEAAAKVDNYQVSLWQKQLLITEVHKLVNFL